MLKLKSILFLPLCLFFATSIWGQGGFSEQITRNPDRAASLKALHQAADQSMKDGDYYNAMHRYGLVIKEDSLNTAAWFGYAAAATENSLYKLAEKAYQHLVETKQTLPNTESPILLLADVQYRIGHYAVAKENYKLFLTAVKTISPGKMDSIENNMDNCDWAIGNVINPNILLQTPLVLIDTPPPYDSAYSTLDTTHVNSIYSEFSPYLKGNTLYFTSKRFPNEKDRHFPKRNLMKVFTTDFCSDVHSIDLADINEPDVHVAHVTFNAAQDQLYYCKCKYVSNFNIHCDLYRRKLNTATQQWGSAIKLPAHVNVPDYTNTEPTIGLAGDSKEEILYFMSDRPGGLGKKDIWYSRILGDSLTPALNLSKINTNGDDVTPFYHNQSGFLYYSTDGLQTMGGLDVYRAKGFAGSSWTTPEHLLAPAAWNTPINTGYNDVFFSVSVSGASIFMASNRRGEDNDSEDACCYDLYKAELLKPNLIASTYNKKTGDSLYSTTLRLLERTTNNQVVNEQKYSVPGASRVFDLASNKNYGIIAEKAHFKSDSIGFETKGSNCPESMDKKLYLSPCEVNLVVTVLEKNTNAKLLDATSKFYDFGLAGTTPANPLKPQSKDLVGDHQIQFKLDYDKTYKVDISKAGYTSASTDLIATSGSFCDTTLRDTVYLRRGLFFKAHTLNALTKDTLYGVTYYLTDLTTGKNIDQYTSPQGKHYQSIITYENRYRITARKEGFTSDSIDFTTLNLKKVAFDTILRELKLRPISVEAYLPIRLYFNNAIPSAVNFDKSEEREYRKSYVKYINEKEPFKKLYTDGLTGMELKNGIDSMEYFFEKEVRAGWDNLMAFSEVLYEMMSRGDTIEITLKGYASKLGSAKYNQALTDRRVSSVYNHFDLFDGGIYKKFVGKQLLFKREANGEADWPKNVSDNVKDKKRSVYDQNASRQRRLEIIGVKTNGNRQIIGVPTKVSPSAPR